MQGLISGNDAPVFGLAEAFGAWVSSCLRVSAVVEGFEFSALDV